MFFLNFESGLGKYIMSTDNFREIPPAKIAQLPGTSRGYRPLVGTIQRLPPQCKARIEKYIPAYGRLLTFLGFKKDNLNDEEFLKKHIELGNLEIVKYLFTNTKYEKFIIREMASKYGQIHILDWAIHLDTPPSFHPYLCAKAAGAGQLETLQWLRAQDPPCPWDNYVLPKASQYGHLEILKWARSQNPPCPWDEHVCEQAASQGQLDVLKWLRAQDPPCPWNKWVCYTAAQHGHLDVLKWLRAQDPPCPWDRSLYDYANHSNQHAVVEWVVEQGL